ncbi:MAG: hypothetical protein IPI60_00295 [Saprospiraceae bacterium]|nr:hypothetical protein [Saprospiraceae bacterium]
MNIRDGNSRGSKKEIVGPSPNSNYLDEATGEEILLASVHGSPKSRYGAGMLYPQQEINLGEVTSDQNENIEDDNAGENQTAEDVEGEKRSRDFSGDGQDEEPVGMANQYLPSAMGCTIRFNSQEQDDKIELSILSAYYEKGKDKKPKKQVSKDGKVEVYLNNEGKTFDSDYWIRRPIRIEPLVFKSTRSS